VICAGEYLIKLASQLDSLNDVEKGILPVFIDRSVKDVIRWTKSRLNADNIIGLNIHGSTHFWTSVFPCLTKDDMLIRGLKERSIHRLERVIFASAAWDGVGGALLPFLRSKFEEWNTNAVALAILPSEYQLPDAHFNAVPALVKISDKDYLPRVLIDKDCLESYVGVDRKGRILRGNKVFHYIVELMLSKDTFIHELVDLSKVFGVNTYTVLLVSGASLDIYGSLENMLELTLYRPLLNFDLSSCKVCFALLRLPSRLAERIPKETVERTISKWFEGKAALKSLEISEPVYVDENNDRVDIIVFVGGFDKSNKLNVMLKRIKEIKSQMISSGYIKKDEWEKVIQSLRD